MAKVQAKIVMTGIICLTTIYIALLLTKNIDGTIMALIVTLIGISIGVIIPSPRIDNKRGELIW